MVLRAIRSALAASRPGDEVVVVDDGSTDGTADAVVAEFGDRIRFIAAAHGGAGATRNRGVDEARCDLVAFLDSDDEWIPSKLHLQRALMAARPDIAFCFSNFTVRDRSGRLHPHYLLNWHNDDRPWSEILGPASRFGAIAELPIGTPDFDFHVGNLYPLEMERNYIPTFTLVVRRLLPGGMPRFPVDLPTYEDWQFFGELAQRGPGAYLDLDTAINHGHDLPRLTDASALLQAEARLKLVSRVWGEDSEFLRRSGAAYTALIAELRARVAFCRAKELLKAGRMSEARAAFAAIAAYPALYAWALRLPGSVVRVLVRVSSALRQLLAKH